MSVSNKYFEAWEQKNRKTNFENKVRDDNRLRHIANSVKKDILQSEREEPNIFKFESNRQSQFARQSSFGVGIGTNQPQFGIFAVNSVHVQAQPHVLVQHSHIGGLSSMIPIKTFQVGLDIYQIMMDPITGLQYQIKIR